MTRPLPPLGIALVGCGAIAGLHAEALAALGAPVMAAVGPDPAQLSAFAAAHGVPRTTASLAEALAWPEVEAVVVATPNDLHAEQTLAAIAAARHVLCEIPLALSLTAAEEVVAAAAAAGVQVMVGHTQRWWGPLPELRRRVAAGDLVVHHVMAQTALLRREDIGMDGRPRPWTDHILWHHGAHLVDTAIGLLGEDVEHIVVAGGERHRQSGRPLDLSVALRTGSGRLATLAVTYGSRLPVQDLLVAAEEETLWLRGAELERVPGGHVSFGDVAAMQRAAMLAQDEHFVRCAAAGAPVRVAAADVLATYRVLQTAGDLLDGGA